MSAGGDLHMWKELNSALALSEASTAVHCCCLLSGAAQN